MARTPTVETRWSAAARQAMKPAPVCLAMLPGLMAFVVNLFVNGWVLRCECGWGVGGGETS